MQCKVEGLLVGEMHIGMSLHQEVRGDQVSV